MAKCLLARTDEPCKRNFTFYPCIDGSEVAHSDSVASSPDTIVGPASDPGARDVDTFMSNDSVRTPHDLANGLSRSSRIQPEWPEIGTRVVAGRPYVTGLGPIRRIDEIDDLPEDMKRWLMGTAQDAHGGGDSASSSTDARSLVSGDNPDMRDLSQRGQHCTARLQLRDDEDSAVEQHLAEPAEVSVPALPSAAYGPVFSPEEIRDSRQLLCRLDLSRTCDAAGNRMLDLDRATCPTRDEYLSALCAKLSAIGLVRLVDTASGLTVTRTRP
ncbi:hypothetical protein [Jiella avicenniae]|uniref:Uncharacterized protein n=1 Tax=Jiella avicenniae TaxID=2907202 RepID=A0A9X1P1K2_9HYPH|nr:hypothetical protein [Jiella avicenniae]MCE7028099.1 hypothetical protein [Jiella avicenniae]